MIFKQIIGCIMHNVINQNMAEKTFINNNNTFSGCLHSMGVVQHFHIDLPDNMHIFQPLRWCDMTLLSWALIFPMLGSVHYPKPFLILILQAPMALASCWHYTLTWVYVNNTLVGPWHYLFALQLSPSFSLIAHLFYSEWKNSFSLLGIQFPEE